MAQEVTRLLEDLVGASGRCRVFLSRLDQSVSQTGDVGMTEFFAIEL